MTLTYLDSVGEFAQEPSQGGFAGWSSLAALDPHLEILKNSDYVVLANDDAAERVVGFIHASKDGVMSADIPLLEVLTSHQVPGIGGKRAGVCSPNWTGSA